MILKPGTRWRSAVDTTEVIVVRGSTDDLDLRCGGAPMGSTAPPAGGRTEVAPEHSAGTAIGKRYEDADTGIEVLCTKAGPASLSIGDRALVAKDAKALPSSD